MSDGKSTMSLLLSACRCGLIIIRRRWVCNNLCFKNETPDRFFCVILLTIAGCNVITYIKLYVREGERTMDADHNLKKEMLRRYLKSDVDANLLDFVVKNAHLIPFWPSERFCDRAGVDEGQMLALIRAFGMESLAEFKDFMRILLYHEPGGDGMVKRPLSGLVEEMIRNEQQNLSDLLAGMDYDRLEDFTQDILSASEVIVTGMGSASPFVGYFCKMLNKLGIAARPMSGVGDILVQLYNHDRSTLIVTFGFARYSKNAVLQLRRLREWGFRIVGITDRHDSPYAALSDYYFFLPVRCFDFVDTYTTGMTLINAVLLNIGQKDPQKLVANLNNYDAIAEDFGLFF